MWGGAYEPRLDVTPADWNIVLNFTARKNTDLRSISIDSSGNAWITGSAGITELRSTGQEVASSPSSDGIEVDVFCSQTSSSQPAVDPSGNRWLLGEEDAVTEVIGTAFFLNAAEAERANRCNSSTNR
jgi:hypothetical protein